MDLTLIPHQHYDTPNKRGAFQQRTVNVDTKKATVRSYIYIPPPPRVQHFYLVAQRKHYY